MRLLLLMMILSAAQGRMTGNRFRPFQFARGDVVHRRARRTHAGVAGAIVIGIVGRVDGQFFSFEKLFRRFVNVFHRSASIGRHEDTGQHGSFPVGNRRTGPVGRRLTTKVFAHFGTVVVERLIRCGQTGISRAIDNGQMGRRFHFVETFDRRSVRIDSSRLQAETFLGNTRRHIAAEQRRTIDDEKFDDRRHHVGLLFARADARRFSFEQTVRHAQAQIKRIHSIGFGVLRDTGKDADKTF